ncbi:MAG: dihydrolipoamide acetyltransferase family protein [Burkholderiales bacterium]
MAEKTQEIIMPQLGETVQEGTVLNWYKKVGDTIKADEPLFDVETEKVTTEIPCPIAGVVTEILVEAGATVPVGTKLAVVTAAAKSAVQGASATAAAAPAKAAVSAPAAASNAEDETIPHNKLRKQVAAHMVKSVATSPHVLQAVEVDFERVEAARNTHGEAWKTREGFALTYLPFIAHAVCQAIKEFPRINASFTDDALIVHKRVHLGVAVDLNFEGLMVPVIRDAQKLNIAALAKEIHRLAAAARASTLVPDEVTGGTYTLSNAGPFGTLITAPIISQPQVAILSTDGVRKKPVVIETPSGDTIAIRPVGVLAQSFDHRAFDGAYSAAFLRRVKEILESSDWSANL